MKTWKRIIGMVKEKWYGRKYLFNTKEGINEDTGEQKIHKAYWKK